MSRKHSKTRIEASDHQDFKECIVRVLRDLLPEYFSDETIYPKISQLAGGVTNRCTTFAYVDLTVLSLSTVFKCKFSKTNSTDVVLVRIYGTQTQNYMDRELELKIMETLHPTGHTPTLFGTFANGHVYSYLEGEPVRSKDELARHSRAIAEKVAVWHQQEIEADKSPKLWKMIDSYLKILPRFTETHIQSLFQNFQSFTDEVDFLKSHLSRLNSPVCFAHNDLAKLNILITPNNEIKFIDYEYAGYNYAAFDIANHFCEWTSDQDYNMDWNLYPNKEQQEEFYKSYLSKALGREANEEEIETLSNQVEQFTLASNLVWGLWGLVQSNTDGTVKDIDFDYFGYAVSRLKRYFELKEKLFACEK